MKKIVIWILIISFLALGINMGIIGLKIFSHDYNVILESYIALICWFIFLICCIFRSFTEKYKCPHCGKVQIIKGNYCSYCGKEI